MSTGTGPCDVPRIDGPGPKGPRAWKVKQERDGKRDYSVTYRVRVDPLLHGPYAALTCPGLPEAGAPWVEGNASPDAFAFFTDETEVTQVGKGTDNQFFDVTRMATNRPYADCIVAGHDDPLTVADRVKIETVNYVIEGTVDRFGTAMVNSAFEQYRGKEVEYDAHRLRVQIEQNVATFDTDLVQSLMHHLNDATMWGFGPRRIKLSHADGEPRYNANCHKYWVRRLTFDIADDFDRCLLDEGTKVLRGQWDRNPQSATYGQYVIAKVFVPFVGFVEVPASDPKSFIRYKDWHAENTRVILNGAGRPWDPDHSTTGTADDTQGRNCFEYYDNGNLLLLGIPLSIE